jgi:erythronate-4-phosphate dehydrogenase
VKIVADSGIPFAGECFARFGELELLDSRAIDPAAVRDADALLVRTLTRVDAALLAGSRVRFVGSATSGIEHVDRRWLEQNGIVFAAAAGCNARSVAEYVLGALFVVLPERLGEASLPQVGIVGCGHAGSALAGLLAACGIGVKLNDPPLAAATGDPRYRPLQELHDVDVLSLHVPLADDGPHPTRHLLDRQLLSSLHDDVLIVNTARGGVIDEAALAEFLAARRTARAVLDVWENEPAFDPALAAVRTPHIAGYSLDGRLRATLAIAESLAAWCGHAGSTPAAVPLPSPLPIDLRGAGDDTGLLRAAVLGAYDPRSDMARFDLLRELPAPGRSRGFVELRNNYPVRREFTAFTVRVDVAQMRGAARLRALGFTVEMY